MRDATDITILLDRSGSMEGIKTDTIGGFNQFLKEQQGEPGECRLTLIQFDDQNPREVVVDNLPIAEVPELTVATFRPRANTPLYDALGQAIVKTGERLAGIDEADRPDKVVFVIVTDGYENASHEYTRDQVFEMVKKQTDEFNWHFVYLGANQDAMQVGASIGVAVLNSANFDPNSQAIGSTYSIISSNVAGLRGGRTSNLAYTADQRARMSTKR